MKEVFIKRCRRPFEVATIVGLFLGIGYLIVELEWSILSGTVIVSLLAHITLLVYEKYLQNSLLKAHLL